MKYTRKTNDLSYIQNWCSNGYCKLRTENTFMVNSKFYRQVDGRRHFLIFKWLNKEKKIAEPTKPQFYKRFVDDIINKCYKDQPDNIFQALSNSHPKIKYTIDANLVKFLDTKIIQKSGNVTNEIDRKYRKLPVHWIFKIPKRYKRNSITSDLNRAWRISSCLKGEISKIRQKFPNTDYPLWFISSA